MRDAVDESVELQYRIDLAADNMIDGPRNPGSLSTAERYKLLLDLRRRWRNLDWAAQAAVQVHGPCRAYDFVGGAFAKLAWTGLDTSRLTVIHMPSREAETTSVVYDDLGVASRDLAFDPTQDLIALHAAPAPGDM